MNTCDHDSYVRTKAYMKSLKSVCNHVLAILTSFIERPSLIPLLEIKRLRFLKSEMYFPLEFETCLEIGNLYFFC